MIKDKIKELDLSEKILYTCFGFLLFLIFLFGLVGLNKFLLFLLSLEANLFLVLIFRYIIKKKKIKFNKVQKRLIFIIVLVIYLFYFFSIIKRKFIYYWDYSTYYNLQMFTRASFDEGLFIGIKKFILSTWSGEYGNFISFFPESIFTFTSKSINSYVLSCVFVFIPYIILSLMILLKTMVNKISIKNENSFIGITLISFILIPVLHATFIYGQPDLFGLVFVFLIISLTIDYDFEKIEIDRFLLLIIITFMLLICRRWDLYFVFAYYICYFINLVVTNIKSENKIKEIIKNWFLFVLIALIFFLITLLPLMKNIISSNFGSSYEFYMAGGLKTELLNQLKHLGCIPLVFILIGIIYGITKQKYRLFSIMNILCYLVMVYLFTRIQNMGLHHSLILLPIYLYFICLFVEYSLSKEKTKCNIFIVFFIICLSINFGFGYFLINDKIIFTDVPLMVEDQKDYKQIGNVASWLKNNINENNSAYMITHNNKYNPDKFRNYYMPDLTIANNLPYGSAILGVHEFPTELFTAKYVITTTPFEAISIEEKYNLVFKQLIDMEKFKLIKDFDMKNKYHILIYERVIDFDREEAELYLESLKEESEKYPNLYRDIINEYINDKLNS